MEHQVGQFQNSSTSNNAASSSARLNSGTLKALSLNSGASLIKKIAAVIVCCFTTEQQKTQYVAQQTLNWDIKAKIKYYTLKEKFHYLFNTKYVF